MNDVKDNKKDLKKIVLIIISIIIVVVGVIFVLNKKEVISDKEKFSTEYTLLGLDNVFVYRTSSEIIDILEHGTGVILFGFPECPWCQRYVVYLNEVAMDLGVEKIYYYNIYEDRKNNTDTYQEIVSLIGDYLQYDNEGNKRVYVPAIIGVNKGNIVGFDDETSVITEDITPDDYWTDEEVNDLKGKLETIFVNASDNMCTSCNED